MDRLSAVVETLQRVPLQFVMYIVCLGVLIFSTAGMVLFGYYLLMCRACKKRFASSTLYEERRADGIVAFILCLVLMFGSSVGLDYAFSICREVLDALTIV